MTDRNIWVIGELRGTEPSPWTLQLVTGARALVREDGGKVSVLIPAAGDDLADVLSAHGADVVTTIDGAGSPPPVEAVVAATREILGGESPAAVIFPDSISGRDVAAQVAAASGSALVSGCERLAYDDDGHIQAIRGCFGGQLAERMVEAATPCFATVAEHAFRARAATGAATAEQRTVSAAGDERIEVLERRLPDPDELDLVEAEVLVSGGVGVGEHGFEVLTELARALGGTTAATRAAVDLGWVPRSKQVGQTGRMVSPRLYFACGISGAMQHMVGLRSAGTVIALNLDEQAPIMREADLAVVGDASAVLPALLRKLNGRGAA